MCPLKILEYYGPYKYWDFPRIGKWTPKPRPFLPEIIFKGGTLMKFFFNLDDFIVKFNFFAK